MMQDTNPMTHIKAPRVQHQHIWKMHWHKIFILAVIMVGSLNLPAAAGDIETGQTLVRQWCQECHLARGNAHASDIAPPFEQIANNRDYTDARLRGWLHDPHPPMPKFELDRRRINDIIAYIRSLKR